MSPDSMTSGWYYAKEGASIGHEVGPLSWAELYILAQVGTLAPGDLVWNPRLPRGVAAGQIPGLFPALVVPEARKVPETRAAVEETALAAPVEPPVPLVPPAAQTPPVVEQALPVPEPQPAVDKTPLAWDLEPAPEQTLATPHAEPASEEVRPAATHARTKVDELFTSAADAPADYDVSLDEPQKPPAGTGHSWLPWLVVLLALVMAAGGLVAYFLFLRDSGDGTGGSGQTLTTQSQTAAGVVITTTEPAAIPAVAAAWTELSPRGDVPSPRDGHGLAYDPGTNTVILFGGSDFDMMFSDTWAYDSSTNSWTKLAPAGSSPSARTYHRMIHDSVSGKVILFGGIDDSSGRNDTWAYDPAVGTWVELQPAGVLPAERQGHAMVYDPALDRLILFGGWDEDRGQMLGDTWSYGTASNTWTDLSPTGALPGARQGHAMIYDPASSQVLLFGGWSDSTGTNLNDTWAYDPAANSWTKLEPAGDVPVARQGHALIYDPGSSQVLLFGGWSLGAELDDTWSYDSAANTWTELSPAGDVPPAREGHSMAYDQAGEKVILFGGFDDPGRSHFSDTWFYGRPSSSR